MRTTPDTVYSMIVENCHPKNVEGTRDNDDNSSFGPNFPRRIRNKQSEVCVNLRAASRPRYKNVQLVNGSKSKKGERARVSNGGRGRERDGRTALNMFVFYFADNKSADSCNVCVINWRTHI